jgi:hypothetical protein
MQNEGLNLHSGKRVGGAFPVVQACTSCRACFPSPLVGHSGAHGQCARGRHGRARGGAWHVAHGRRDRARGPCSGAVLVAGGRSRPPAGGGPLSCGLRPHPDHVARQKGERRRISAKKKGRRQRICSRVAVEECPPRRRILLLSSAPPCHAGGGARCRI